MPRRYTLHKVPPAQARQWDAFMNEHPQGHFLQSWGWGEFKASAGWFPLRLALEEDGRMAAAAQILCRGVPHLPLQVGHLAYIPKGPIIDWSDPPLCRAFLTQLHSYVKRRGAVALLMEPNQQVEIARDDCLMESLASSQFYPTLSIQPVRSILLDLSLDEATLLAQMKEKWRYNLRLAERKGVKVRVAESSEDVRAWYALMQVTSKRDGFGIHSLEYYLHAWHLFALGQQARLFLAELDGQLLAGIFVALFAHEGIYLYGASSNEQRNVMPNYLLQWEAIRWAKQQGASRYDFWGIPATEHEGETMAGVYRFKRGWGGEVVRFVGCYEQVYRPKMMKLARRWVRQSL